MNIAVFRTRNVEYFFLDYRGKWRPIGELKKCQPKTFVSGIPQRYRTPEPGTLWTEPYPDVPNLKKLGLVDN